MSVASGIIVTSFVLAVLFKPGFATPTVNPTIINYYANYGSSKTDDIFTARPSVNPTTSPSGTPSEKPTNSP